MTRARSTLAVALLLVAFAVSVLWSSATVDRPNSGDTTPTRTTTDPAVAPATSGATAAVPDGARGATGSSAWPDGSPSARPLWGAPPVALSP